MNLSLKRNPILRVLLPQRLCPTRGQTCDHFRTCFRHLMPRLKVAWKASYISLICGCGKECVYRQTRFKRRSNRALIFFCQADMEVGELYVGKSCFREIA
jgi:hypothetical protein